MAGTKGPAISGVAANREVTIHTVFPSIAATGFGKALGKLYDSIPTRIGGLKLSHLLFPLPTSPLAVLEYLRLKAVGLRYVLTNRSVQLQSAIASRVRESVPLASIADVKIVQEAGQAFYPAADLYLLNAKGEALLVLPGVPWPEVFRRNILEARDARVQVESSLATIQKRK